MLQENWIAAKYDLRTYMPVAELSTPLMGKALAAAKVLRQDIRPHETVVVFCELENIKEAHNAP